MRGDPLRPRALPRSGRAQGFVVDPCRAKLQFKIGTTGTRSRHPPDPRRSCMLVQRWRCARQAQPVCSAVVSSSKQEQRSASLVGGCGCQLLRCCCSRVVNYRRAEGGWQQNEGNSGGFICCASCIASAPRMRALSAPALVRAFLAFLAQAGALKRRRLTCWQSLQARAARRSRPASLHLLHDAHLRSSTNIARGLRVRCAYKTTKERCTKRTRASCQHTRSRLTPRQQRCLAAAAPPPCAAAPLPAWPAGTLCS